MFMSEEPKPVDVADISHTETTWEDKEFLDRQSFNRLRSTFGHYMGNSLALALGYGELTTKHPDFPQDEPHQTIAQASAGFAELISVTQGVLSTVGYNTKLKREGKFVFFDLDEEIQRRLQNSADGDPYIRKEPQELEEKGLDRFKIYQDTIDKYMGDALSGPRATFEALEEELRDLPEVHILAQETHEGILRATAVKDLLSNLTPDAKTDADSVSTWYKLDDQIEERFQGLQQTYEQYRKPD